MKMSKISLVYNGSLLTGLALVGSGLWQFSPGAALAIVGVLILVFTVYGAERLARFQKGNG